MNAALCREVGAGAFPTPAQVAACGAEQLQKRCGLGYRARTVCKLAEQVLSGSADLQALEDPSIPQPELRKALLGLPGMGPYTSANVLQLLGHYSCVPCDSETLRHLQDVHGLRRSTMATVQADAQKLYSQYAPYEYMAYWFEIWQSYEALIGCSFELADPSLYGRCTGTNMRKQAKAKSPFKAESADQASPGASVPTARSVAGAAKAPAHAGTPHAAGRPTAAAQQ
eukprot:jgi/Astpho2/3845/Aster-x0598